MYVYFITNGRSTAVAACDYLGRQAGVLITEIVSNERLPHSFNYALHCPEPYFTIVADDFILYRNAIVYMEHVIRQAPPEVGMICFRVWDTLISQPIEGIKVYRTQAVRDVGGFRVNEQNKVDRNMLADLPAKGYKVIRDGNTCLALHIHGNLGDLKKYEQLWQHRKYYHDLVKANQVSAEQQISIGFKFLERFNRENNNEYHQQFINLK